MKKSLFRAPWLWIGIISVIILTIGNFDRKVNAENSWDQIIEDAPGHSTFVVGFINELKGITVGYMGECHYTIDGGKTWPEGNNQSMCRYGLEIINDKVAWTSGNGSNVRFTLDGGVNWNEAQNYGKFGPLHCRFLSFYNETSGWIASPTQLGATIDQGKTWQDIALPADVKEVKAIDLRSPQKGYLLDSNGFLYISGDFGKTWEKRTLGISMGDYINVTSMSPTVAMRFMDDNHGKVIIRQKTPGQTWIELDTADGGKTWQSSAVPGNFGTIFLTRDGRFLSLINSTGTIQLFRKH
jgi:photosystem II stability/assembly factor-like uncharacterized protein